MAQDVVQPLRPEYSRATAQPDPATAEQDIDLGQVLNTIWWGKLWIVICMVIMIAIGGYYAYGVAVPTYRGTAIVMLETRQEQVVDLESVVSGLSADTSVVNTEVEVLQSRILLGKVVDRLNLTEDPEFNKSLAEISTTDWLKYTIKDVLGLARASEEFPEEEQAARTRAGTVGVLKQSLLIRNVPNSLVFSVTAESIDPKKAALIANTLVDQYITDQLESKFAATEKATSWLTTRVTEFQAELELAEEKVKEFRANADLTSEEALAGNEVQLKTQRERLESLQQSLQAATQQRDALLAAQTREKQAAAVNDPSLTQFLTRIDSADIQAAFDSRVQDILARFELEMARDSTRIDALVELIEALEEKLFKSNEDSILLQQLVRESEASRLLYEYFLTRLKETSAQQGVQQADSRVLSWAEAPFFPTAPRKSLILAASLIFGLVIGIVFVLLREMRWNTFRDAEQLEGLTGQLVTGQVPLMKARNHAYMVDYLIKRPTSAAAEAVRNLRTSIMLNNGGMQPQVIMFTSSVPGEGKTSLSMALAQNFSGVSKSVLLIEGDTRRRVLSRYLDTEQTKGLSDVLVGDSNLEDVIVQDERLGVSVLPAGQSANTSPDNFASPNFSKMMIALRETFDFIIIDTPPILVVPDARVVLKFVDSVQFVVQWDATPKAQVAASMRLFRGAGMPPVGVVLNKIKSKGMRKYGYGSYYGAYGGGYYNN